MALVEADIHALKTSDAVAAVHRKNVETRLSNIEAGIRWLIGLFGSGLVMAMVAWIIGGGLTL